MDVLYALTPYHPYSQRKSAIQKPLSWEPRAKFALNYYVIAHINSRITGDAIDVIRGDMLRSQFHIIIAYQSTHLTSKEVNYFQSSKIKISYIAIKSNKLVCLLFKEIYYT